MTTHYIIHSKATGRTLKVTYRAGQFYRLEKVSGKKLTAREMANIGLVVPPEEAQLPEYYGRYDQVEYTKVEKEKSVYQRYTDAWFRFYYDLEGYPPKFSGADGAALNQIKAHLTKLEGGEQEGLALFKVILESWHKLEDFHRQNTDLKYINTRLNVILNAIKRANEAGTAGTDHGVSI